MSNFIGVAPKSSRRIRHPLLGMYCLILATSLLFLGLCTTFLFFQLQGMGWPPPGTPEPSLLLPISSVLVLAASSGAMRWAGQAVRRNDTSGLRLGLVLAMLFGGIFLANQAYTFFDMGLPVGSGLWIAILYMLIILHALHLVGGMIFIGVTLARANTGDFSSQRHLGVDACEIFWQFVVWIWAVLFGLLYLL